MSESSTSLPLEAQHAHFEELEKLRSANWLGLKPYFILEAAPSIYAGENEKGSWDVSSSIRNIARVNNALGNAEQWAKLFASAPALLEALRNTQETIAEQHPGTMETCSCTLAKQYRANEKAIRDAEGKI